MEVDNKKMAEALKQALKAMALTSRELEIVTLLRSSKTPLTAKQLQKNKENNYQHLNNLLKRKFIKKTKHYPAKYKLVPLKHKLKKELIAKQKTLSILLAQLDPTTTDFEPDLPGIGEITYLKSKREFREFGINKMKTVERGISVFASGRTQPTEFYDSFKEVIKRGGFVRFLVNRPLKRDLEMYAAWQEDDIAVKKASYPGIGFIVYEDRTVQIALKSSYKQKRMCGVVIDNPIFAKFMEEVFHKLWWQYAGAIDRKYE